MLTCYICQLEFTGTVLSEQLELIKKKDDKPYRVLVVEDSEINQLMAGHLLSGLGCEPEFAKDGETAVMMAKNNDYDIIFMDCKMPIMNGFEATRAIRDYENKNRDKKRVPIVAVTAKVLKGDRENCIRAGMDDYMDKPIRKDKVCQMINKWCANYTEFADVW